MGTRTRERVRALTRPRMLALHLLTVVAVTAATLLGLWQLGAWQAHREDRAAGLADAAPVPLEAVMRADDPFPADGVGRPVRFAGRWLPADTVYVERGSDGRAGFWVVTPVATCDADQPAAGPEASGCPAMLVVRGWSAAHPAPAPPGARTVEVTGWLQPGESAQDGAADQADGATEATAGSDVVSSVRVADIVQRVDRDLFGGYVIAESPADPALQPVTPASLPDPPAFTAVRNLLYAVEWWVFGLFAVFLWVRWCRDETAVADAASEQEGPEVATEGAEDRPVPSAP